MHTRYFVSAVTALTAFFLFAAPALANTTNLSFDPSYAAQSFTYYCQPYKLGFETGKHYIAQNGGACAFSIPSSVTGNETIALYKGTPGNATFVSGDVVSGGAPTLVQENSTTFGSPLQDQNYFAVVYGTSNPGDAAAFDASFQTGSSTNTLPPTSDYALLQWKWGSKPTSEYVPVVLIPDILNSWQNDTGLFIDPIFHIYQNLIDTFVDNGYVLNQNLFTFPYNWQNSNVLTAQTLGAQIQAIKVSCGCSRVDIIGHGMGGTVAEQYIQSAGYQNDVDQLVLLGTPILGLPAAYQAWEGGQISFGSPLSDGLAQVFLGASAKDGGYASVFDYIQHKPVTSIQELLPTYDYLFDSGFNELFYPTGYPRNAFLESLQAALFGKAFNKVRVNTILGDDGQVQTTSAFVIAPTTQAPLWPDGQPTQVVNDSGDGMVPRASIENLVGTANQEFATTHRALPTTAESYIFNLFNNKLPSPVIANNYPVSCVLFLTTSASANMQITDPNGNRLGKDFSNNGILNEIGNSFYSGFTSSPEYGIVVNPINGIYQIRTQGNGNGSFSVNASDVCGQGIVATSTAPTNTTPGQLIGLQVTVATSTQTLTIAPLDINPPAVTINNPQANHTYFQGATTSISATFVDPENSPIGTSTYRINGSLVNPTQPIVFANLPLGTSTIIVTATDVFGNTGSATSSFNVSAAPVTDTQPPVITITSPLKYGLYARTDSVFLTATITDQSPIAASTYWFNGVKINPANPLMFTASTPIISKVSVAAKDSFGNAATSTLAFFVVKTKSSCLLDIVAIFLAYRQDKTLPDKLTLQNLIDDCSALATGRHRYDDDGRH